MTDLIKYFPFLAIGGVIASFWVQSKNFFLKLFHIFWKKRIIYNNFSQEAYLELRKKSKVISFDDYKLTPELLYSSKNQTYLSFLVKNFNFQIFLYKNFIPILIFGGANGLNIQYLKFTFDFEEFIFRLTKNKNDITLNTKNELCHYFELREIKGQSFKKRLELQNNSNKGESIKPPADKISNHESNFYPMITVECALRNKIPIIDKRFELDDLSFYSLKESPKNKYIFTSQGKYVLFQVKKWLESASWYHQRNIVFKRACLLHGCPGSGKSSLILEIAKKLNLPIYIVDLSTFDNQEFEEALNNNIYNDVGIILFEDIDAVFNFRENKHASKEYGGITFDYFINKLSGVNGIKNKFLFFTTNHIENLDSALLRDGRIDEKIELNSINMEEKIYVAKTVFDNDEKLINKVMENCDKDTTSEFENKCIKIALNQYWGNKI